jgi:hypothetical protein
MVGSIQSGLPLRRRRPAVRVALFGPVPEIRHRVEIVRELCALLGMETPPDWAAIERRQLGCLLPITSALPSTGRRWPISDTDIEYHVDFSLGNDLSPRDETGSLPPPKKTARPPLKGAEPMGRN